MRDGCPNGSHTDTHTERSIGAVPEQSQEAGVVAILQATIDTLQGQLSVKDKQIEELNARLAEVSSALVVAQQTAQAPRHFMPEQFGSSLLMVKMSKSTGADGGAEKKLVFKSFWWQIGNKSIFFSSVQVRKAV